MGIIPNQMVKMTGVANRNYYEKLGYDVPKHIGTNGKLQHDSTKSFWVDVLDLPNNTGKLIGCTCDECEKILVMPKSSYTKYNRGGKIYCVSCANKLFNSGENHSAWNPNLTDEQRDRNRKSSEYIEFTRKVLARDNYTCQICGYRGNDLEVHHLDGYNWCVEKRLDISNGITLCPGCHGGYHGVYGKGNNTKEQFIQWSNMIDLNLMDYQGDFKTRRRVYCFETQTMYESALDAAEKLNCTEFSIYGCCAHNSNSHNHYHFCYESEYINMTEEDKNNYVNKGRIFNYRLDKRVICLNTLQIFSGMTQVCKTYEYVKISNLASHLSGHSDYIGLRIDDKFAVFLYYEDYIKMSESEVKEKLNNGQPVPKYVCLNNKKFYYSIKELESDINITIATVGTHIKNIEKCSFAGRDKDTNEPLIWMYYNDYIIATEEEIQYRLSFSKAWAICLTLGIKIYQGKEASKICEFNNPSGAVSHACSKSKSHIAGKLPDGTPLKWMYYSEFTTLPSEKQLEIIEKNLQTLEEGSFLMQKYEELTKEKAS